MRADGEATGPPASAILDEVAALARTEDPQAKPCQIVVPYEIVGCTRLCLILLLLAARRPAASDVEVAPTAVRT